MTTILAQWRTLTAFAAVLFFACTTLQAQRGDRRYGDRDSGGGDRRNGDRGDRRYGDRSQGNDSGRGRSDERRGDERRSFTPPGSSPSGSTRPSNQPMGVQGFSVDKNRPQTPGFNVPLEVPGGNLQDRYDKRVIDRADKEVMPRFDRDKDGFLSLEESKESSWDPPFETSDIDKDGRLSHFELYERYAKKMNLPAKGAVVSSTGSSSGRPSDGSGGGGGNDQAKVAEYAKGLLTQYDANKDGLLQKDEWSKMKSDHQAADTNKDGIITTEELAVKLASFGSSSSSSSSAGSSQPQGGNSYGRGRGGWGGGRDSTARSSEKGDSRKSYRVPTATERLPKGLPDWFARNDVDADGQVAMAEYMTELTDSKAAEFLKFDLDGDGIITPEECLEVEGKAKKK